jgi:hypothetical protein
LTKPNKFTLPVEIESQPTDSACGATSLQAIYKFWDDPISVAQIMSDVPQLKNGGTLAGQLGCHALARGYAATIFTYNVELFDPTWFKDFKTDVADRLRRQKLLKEKHDQRLAIATDSYLKFLDLGGQILMEPLEGQLIKQQLLAGLPILVGLSATFLYQESRERPHPPDDQGISGIPDDIGGLPVGHFVVLSGYDESEDVVLISDPLHPNPRSPDRSYWASLEHLTTAILLGIVTYDANLLVVQPKDT